LAWRFGATPFTANMLLKVLRFDSPALACRCKWRADEHGTPLSAREQWIFFSLAPLLMII